MNKKKIIVLLSILGVIIASVIAGVIIHTNTVKSMPNVVGMKYDDAEEKIESSKEIKVEKVKGKDEEAYKHERDYVYKQSVKPGDNTDSVTLYVCKGIAHRVPDLVNKDYYNLDSKTKEMLSKIPNITVLYQYGTKKAGTIMATNNDEPDSKGIRRVYERDGLQIIVCKKKVPYDPNNMTKKNWYKIKKYFKGAKIILEKEDDDKKAGTILSSSQEAKPKGKRIEIYVNVSNGQGVRVPDLTGYSEKKARRLLDKRGANYRIKYVFKDLYANASKMPRKVRSQSNEGMLNKKEKLVVKVNMPAIKINQINHEVNSAGGVDTDIRFTNHSTKTIDYVKILCRYYNTVGDPITDEITDDSAKTLRYTGPLSPGSSDEGHWDAPVYDYSTAAVAPQLAIIEFRDGSRQTITYMKKNKSFWYWYDGSRLKNKDLHEPLFED